MRLASRISDLKMKGYDIDSSYISVKNRYGEKCKIKRYFFKKVLTNQGISYKQLMEGDIK